MYSFPRQKKSTALMMASSRGDVTMVESLIAAGANVNLQNDVSEHFNALCMLLHINLLCHCTNCPLLYPLRMFHYS